MLVLLQRLSQQFRVLCVISRHTGALSALRRPNTSFWMNLNVSRLLLPLTSGLTLALNLAVTLALTLTLALALALALLRHWHHVRHIEQWRHR